MPFVLCLEHADKGYLVGLKTKQVASIRSAGFLKSKHSLKLNQVNVKLCLLELGVVAIPDKTRSEAEVRAACKNSNKV